MFVGNWLAMPRKKCLLSNRCPAVWKWEHVYWRASLTPKNIDKTVLLGREPAAPCPLAPDIAQGMLILRSSQGTCTEDLGNPIYKWDMKRKQGERVSNTSAISAEKNHHLKGVLSGSRVPGKFNGWLTSPSYKCLKNSWASMETPPISPKRKKALFRVYWPPS